MYNLWDVLGKLLGVYCVAVFFNFLIRKIRKRESLLQKYFATGISTALYIVIPTWLTNTTNDFKELLGWAYVTLICGFISCIFFKFEIRIKKILLILLYGFFFTIPAVLIYNLAVAFLYSRDLYVTTDVRNSDYFVIPFLFILFLILSLVFVTNRKLPYTKNL